MNAQYLITYKNNCNDSATLLVYFATTCPDFSSGDYADLHRLLTAKLFLFFFFLLSSTNCLSQTNLNGVPEDSTSIIQWVGQFPPEGKDQLELSKRLTGILIGQKASIISKPIAVLANSRNDYFILDHGNGTVFKVVENKAKELKIHKNAEHKFASAVGICRMSPDKLLITDSQKNTISMISQAGKTITTLADSSLLQQPTGIAFNSSTHEIWIVETRVHKVTILNESGSLVRSIGSRGENDGEFNFPTSIWIDKSGKVYIVDAMNFRIQIFDVKGNFISAFGKHGDATGDFSRPKGIATDSRNNIYVADALFHVVQIFDSEGNFLYYFGKQGRGKGEFWMPGGIFIDEADYIYVTDTYNSRVQIFKLNKEEE